MPIFSLTQNYTWKVANYYSSGNYHSIANDVTTFIDILPQQALNASKVFGWLSATPFNECNYLNYYTGIFFVPQLSISASANSLSGQWSLYNTGTQEGGSSFNDALSFLNNNLTFAQAFYSKVDFTQEPCYGCTTYSKCYIWYPELNTEFSKGSVGNTIMDNTAQDSSWSV